MYLIRCFVKNWGDSLNVPMFRFISGQDPVSMRHGFKLPQGQSVYMVLGSILGWANLDTIVWGAGYMSATTVVENCPQKICAVRGPFTYKQLQKQGVPCPEIYGDPALLYPKFYMPKKIVKKYKLGIIPHYIDKKVPLVDIFKDKEDIQIVDIQGPINQVVNDICSCERIASSCLHGIICADAYGIPSTWIKFSNNVLGRGFKFRDYFASVGRKDTEPLTVEKNTSVQQVLDRFYDYKIDIDLDTLYDVCPFYKKDN